MIETSATDGYQLEDGSGVLILEPAATAPTYVQLERPTLRGIWRGVGERT